MAKTTPPVYQIKITLVDSKPLIWRRVLVSGDSTLADLHAVIQAVMPWDDFHLHLFMIDDEQYSPPMEDFADDLGMNDERRAKLSHVVPDEKFKFTYEYDFGDSWHHTLLVEKILPFDPAQKLPACVAGKRACPPEDSGGIWSYPGFLDALTDPAHPDHDRLAEWMGDEPFDPETFDLEAANLRLRDLP